MGHPASISAMFTEHSLPRPTGAPSWSQREEQQARARKVWPGAGQWSLTYGKTGNNLQYMCTVKADLRADCGQGEVAVE